MYSPISYYGENGLTLLQKNDPLRVPDCTLSPLLFGASNSIDAVLMREPAGEPVDSDRSNPSILPTLSSVATVGLIQASLATQH